MCNCVLNSSNFTSMVVFDTR
uniref:Uncharacterized protein n=1 Tax=Lepeophtheirus salmonis TaxID=72036 RepID=A0A0K2TLA5_LEPSM